MNTLKSASKSTSTEGSVKPQHFDTADYAPKRRNAGRGNMHHARNDVSVHQQPKRGGQSLNHLLSFTLPPRSSPPLAGPARRSRRGAAYTPFNKERYVNAQYRFLVKPTGDYTAYFADPDIYLNWADILQVVIPTSSALAGVGSSAPISDQPLEPAHEGAACPICLSPPTAPRMTKCGHVFCYPCILHYLTITEENNSRPTAPTLQQPTQKWRRCPICWDAVYARDLKAVRWWDAQAAAREHESKLQEQHDLERARRISELDEDGHDASGAVLSDDNAPSLTHHHPDMLALRLVERPNVTTLALPQSVTWPASELDHPLIAVHSAPWHFQPDVMGFAKFMLATPDLLIESLEKDLQELNEEIGVLKSFGTDASGLQFVALAQRKVREQMQKVRDELDLPIVRSSIGQARNDLKDHQAALSGELQRTDLSRRQRKRMERSQTDEEPDSTAPFSRDDISAARDGTPEAALGAEEFLALRAQTQGGLMGHASSDGGAKANKDDAASQGIIDTTHKTGPARQPKARKNVNPPQPESSSYVFFQAASGQSIFLHPLDTKILLSHYGAYANLPRNLAVKVIGADEGSMNEELRRRCKYLNHLPMAADVVFIEVDWESMNLISKATLRPYEQALRQRRNRRRDKERREDRAKTRAEEAELVSNQGGPAAAAAYRRQQEQLAAFTSEANFPSDGLSRSFENGRSGGGVGSAIEGVYASGSSPSFRESAMFGAEREFPLHRGTAETEDFPDSLRGTRDGLERVSISSDDQAERRVEQSSQRMPARGAAPVKKTVWGTPATKASFSNAIQGRGSDAHGIWDDHMEDAWHELEEDYILGSTGSGRRPTGAVREGRGLNRQSRSSNGAAGGGGVAKGPTAWANNAGSKEAGQEATKEVAVSTASEDAPSSEATASAKSKRIKKKLILTGGGGGRGSR
ncbi:RING-finger protein MAG2 [Pseudozyma hubeiensis]|nr:RING-finger protein MAG2 [Pseudozyma hubeiensis]